jgi:uncharacterized membrane protein
MSHSHAHAGLGDLGPAPTRIRLVVALVLAPLTLATLGAVWWLWPEGGGYGFADQFVTERAHGEVTEVGECRAGVPECRSASVRLERGPGAPGEVDIVVPFGDQAPEVRTGDRVVLAYTEAAPEDQRYTFQDIDRTRTLTWLLAMFVAGVLLLSRWRGLGSLGSLALSLFLLVTFTLPALSEGRSPLLVAIATAGAIMMTTLWLSHGFSVRTGVAIIGTLFALILTGVLGHVFTTAGRFTGMTDDASQYIAAINAELDVGGLLLAGLVIGALGVLDDVTVTQTAAVWELAHADPHASRRSLFLQGMRIGREHVASTVNTLALAYVGAMLPVLLVVSALALPFASSVSQELIAQEVVRGLVGGIGIVAAVPITTALAAVVAGLMADARRAA